jgi:hypothetical protein
MRLVKVLVIVALVGLVAGLTLLDPGRAGAAGTAEEWSYGQWRHYETGVNTATLTVNPGMAFELLEFDMHLDAAASGENLVVNVDKGAGAVYDQNLITEPMSGVADYGRTWEPGKKGVNGDAITVSFPNVGRTWGVELKWHKLQER